ncbi:MAG: hypothetical protein KatS3mg008_1302 [Acidimicrobiales bacterium]|nr:MAG: hypothetical protein KatS3mg008_1302 [Acidimicrobiales bacterium]
MADRFRTFRTLVQIDMVWMGRGPLLVRAGGASPPELPDMSFVRYPTEVGPTPFLPGSSLKGVLRTGAEQLARATGGAACDPFSRDSCGRRDDRERCEICLLFGSTRGAGVLMVDDALPWRLEDRSDVRKEKLEAVLDRSVVRHGVGIDRSTGTAARGVLYDFEALVDPVFFGSLRLRNPDGRQLALTAGALRMLAEDMLRVGGMGSRGLGRVIPKPRRIAVFAADRKYLEDLPGADHFGDPKSVGIVSEWVAGGPAADARARAAAADELLKLWERTAVEAVG